MNFLQMPAENALYYLYNPNAAKLKISTVFLQFFKSTIFEHIKITFVTFSETKCYYDVTNRFTSCYI